MLQLGQLASQRLREQARRHFATPFDIEDMGRIAALLVVAHHVVGGKSRRGGAAQRIERHPPDETKPQLVSVRQEAGGDRQVAAHLVQRFVAAIGKHCIGLRVKGHCLLFIAAFPPDDRQAVGERRVHFGQQAREPAGEQRFGAGQFADVAGFDQQSADQAPQRQRRHVAGPAVNQQFGSERLCHAALGARLEFVEQLGVGEVLGDEAMQLRRAKGLEECR